MALDPVITPASAPAPQLLQGKMTYIGLAIAFSGLLAKWFGPHYPADQVNDTITFIGANYDSISQFVGILIAAFGRLRQHWRTSAAMFLLGACIGLTSCNTLTIAATKKDGTKVFATSTSVVTSSKQRTHELALDGIGSAKEAIVDEDETSVAKMGITGWGAATALKSNNALAATKDTNATNTTINASNNATKQAINASNNAVKTSAINAGLAPAAH